MSKNFSLRIVGLAVSFNPVISRKGRPTCRNVNQSEQSHSGVSAHRPLLRLTVGLTAVVHEARLVSLRPCVDDAVLTQRQTDRQSFLLKYTCISHM